MFLRELGNKRNTVKPLFYGYLGDRGKRLLKRRDSYGEGSGIIRYLLYREGVYDRRLIVDGPVVVER